MQISKKIWFIAPWTTVTFCYFSQRQRPEVIKLYKLSAICVHQRDFFALFLFGPAREGNFVYTHTETTLFAGKSKRVSICMYSVIHCRRRLLLHKKVVLGTRIESTPLFVPAASFHWQSSFDLFDFLVPRRAYYDDEWCCWFCEIHRRSASRWACIMHIIWLESFRILSRWIYFFERPEGPRINSFVRSNLGH